MSDFGAGRQTAEDPDDARGRPPEYHQSDYGAPADGQPGYQQPGYQQAGYQQPGYQQSGYQQPGYQQAGYQQPGYAGVPTYSGSGSYLPPLPPTGSFPPPPPPPPPPRRSNTALIVAFAIVAAVGLFGGAIAIALVVSRTDSRNSASPAEISPPSARTSAPTAGTSPAPARTSPAPSASAAVAVADQYVLAVNARDEDAAVALFCSAQADSFRQFLEGSDSDFNYTIGPISARRATLTDTSTRTVAVDTSVDDGSGTARDVTYSFPVITEGGQAKLCGEDVTAR